MSSEELHKAAEMKFELRKELFTNLENHQQLDTGTSVTHWPRLDFVDAQSNEHFTCLIDKDRTRG